MTVKAKQVARSNAILPYLPLGCSVVGRGLLNLPVVGQIGLVAHQYEGDVVVVLHPQYLISKLLKISQDLQTSWPGLSSSPALTEKNRLL